MDTDRKTGGGDIVSHPHYRHPLLQRLSPFLRCLDPLPDSAARRPVQWSPQAAAMAAVLMTIDHGCTQTVRCHDVLTCMRGDYRRKRRTGKTYNGLMKAITRQAPQVLPVIKLDLRQQARKAMMRTRKVGKWTLLAVDGSKEELPRTQDLENHFGVADNGKCPQAMITSIVEVHTGLLWDWRIGKARSSEREHLQQMVLALPANSLLLADAYYVGYELWSAMHNAGKEFLIRVGGNVGLIRDLFPDSDLERIGDTYYVWPERQQKKGPPLKVRLIKVKGGKSPMYLVTNVFDRRRLSRKRAGKIYRLRWGVELFYRTFKRSLNLAKLQSRSAKRAKVELEWAMVTMSILILLGIGQLTRRRIDPALLSPATLIHALRYSLLHDGPARSPAVSARELARVLGRAVRDSYVRKRPKRSRHCPVTTNTPNHQLQAPHIRKATADERHRAMEAGQVGV